MVKGTSRHVIVVKSPDPRFFDEAIFIVKEDLSPCRKGGTSDILKEARRVADEYIRSTTPTGPGSVLSRLPRGICAALGAAIAALVFFLCHLAGL